jgi:hypothetical protein
VSLGVTCTRECYPYPCDKTFVSAIGEFYVTSPLLQDNLAAQCALTEGIDPRATPFPVLLGPSTWSSNFLAPTAHLSPVPLIALNLSSSHTTHWAFIVPRIMTLYSVPHRTSREQHNDFCQNQHKAFVLHQWTMKHLTLCRCTPGLLKPHNRGGFASGNRTQSCLRKWRSNPPRTSSAKPSRPWKRKNR